MTTITYEEFDPPTLKLRRTRRVWACRPKLCQSAGSADFGSEIGVLQTSAQVTVHYTTQTLLGRQIVGCVNLGEKNIAGFTSQFLLVGFADESDAICLITVDPKVPNGQKMC